MNSRWQKIRTYWKQLSIESRGSIAIIIPLICLIGAVVADTLLRQKIMEAQVYVNHTNQVLVTSQNTLISLLNAETGVRGYYIGKQKVFLEPYSLALTDLEPALIKLEELVQDNPLQLQRVQLLTQTAQRRMMLLKDTVQRVENNITSNPANINQRLLAGKKSMDQFRDVVDQLETEEHRLLEIRTRSLQEQQQLNAFALWCGIAISLLGTVLATKLLRQLATELQEREVRLHDSRNLIQAIVAKLQAKALQMTALNNSLLVSNQSLLQTNRELDQFAYITSHDLKAPLRAIASLSEWIEEDLGDSVSTTIRSQIKLLRSRAYRMQALLNSLLEYSRSGRQQSPVTTVDVGQLLTAIIQSLAHIDTFTINIELPMPIMSTRQPALQQVFTHLIDNALRHHPTETGIVKISVIDRDDCYEFAVADDGDGIDPQFQERIYTIFQTLKARDQQENIGAGLAIVKKIITAEGGTIKLESAVGSGAIFRFTWLKQPIVKEDTSTSYES